MYYVLDKNNQVQPAGTEEGLAFFDNSRRFLARDNYKNGYVSTVFLVIDHSLSLPSKGPVLFETMVFGGPLNLWQERARTYSQALKIHKDVNCILAAIDHLRGQSWRRAKKKLSYYYTIHDQPRWRHWFSKAQYKAFNHELCKTHF